MTLRMHVAIQKQENQQQILGFMGYGQFTAITHSLKTAIAKAPSTRLRYTTTYYTICMYVHILICDVNRKTVHGIVYVKQTNRSPTWLRECKYIGHHWVARAQTVTSFGSMNGSNMGRAPSLCLTNMLTLKLLSRSRSTP